MMENQKLEIFTNASNEIFLKLHRKISRHSLVLLKKYICWPLIGLTSKAVLDNSRGVMA